MIHRSSPAVTRTVAGVSVLVTTAVLLAGCGSSATKSLSAPSVKPVATTSGAVSGAVPSAAASPEPAVSSAPAAGGGDSNSSFCILAKSFVASSATDEAAFGSDSPTALKAYIATAQKEVSEFAAAAPASIQAATQKLVALDTQIFAALKSSNYDFSAASAAIAKVGSDPGLAAASTQVTTYLSSTCQIADPSTSAGAEVSAAEASASSAEAGAEASASAAIAAAEASASAAAGG